MRASGRNKPGEQGNYGFEKTVFPEYIIRTWDENIAIKGLATDEILPAFIPDVTCHLLNNRHYIVENYFTQTRINLNSVNENKACIPNVYSIMDGGTDDRITLVKKITDPITAQRIVNLICKSFREQNEIELKSQYAMEKDLLVEGQYATEKPFLLVFNQLENRYIPHLFKTGSLDGFEFTHMAIDPRNLEVIAREKIGSSFTPSQEYDLSSELGKAPAMNESFYLLAAQGLEKANQTQGAEYFSLYEPTLLRKNDELRGNAGLTLFKTRNKA
ncbi:hypothetical protein KY366_02980 [Candidatus Woesearchaeota archaeon]|nr:hypothetical protein [Candidatus Woesearchaeota archaeon]